MTDELQALSDAAREAKARAFHEMTQIGGPWSPCGGEFGVPLDCLCYEMVSDIETAFAASPSPDTDRDGGLRDVLAILEGPGRDEKRRTAAIYDATERVRNLIDAGLRPSPDTDAGLDERDRIDAEKWRAAEAEGHTVDFTETGYGLQHPPSCRPDLIGCWFNVYLADLGYPEEDPGRYRMTRHKGHAEYARLATPEGQPEHVNQILAAISEWHMWNVEPTHIIVSRDSLATLANEGAIEDWSLDSLRLWGLPVIVADIPIPFAIGTERPQDALTVLPLKERQAVR